MEHAPCESCDGSGHVEEGGFTVDCTSCGGTGHDVTWF